MSTSASRAPLMMTIGPTRMTAAVLARAAVQPPPITDAGFLSAIGRCTARLRKLFGAPSSAQLVIPGTGTMGMEMLAVNFVPPRSTVVVACTGYWGQRWAEICTRGGHRVQRVSAAPGEPIDLNRLEDALRTVSPAALFVTHVDSSSGVTADLAGIGALAAQSRTLLLVDGICGAGAEPCHQNAWGVDVYLASTPKAIAAPAGLVLISIGGEAARWLGKREWVPASYALDIRPWLSVFRHAEHRQFEYFQSPAGNLLLALDESLQEIFREGLNARYDRHRRCRDVLHASLERMGIEVIARGPERSTAVTVCRYPNGRADGFLAAVLDRGVVLPAGSHPEIASATFRIGHLGNIQPCDIELTLQAIQAACGSLEGACRP